jgi:hypothetical protein
MMLTIPPIRNTSIIFSIDISSKYKPKVKIETKYIKIKCKEKNPNSFPIVLYQGSLSIFKTSSSKDSSSSISALVISVALSFNSSIKFSISFFLFSSKFVFFGLASPLSDT